MDEFSNFVARNGDHLNVPSPVKSKYKLVEAADIIGYEWTGKAHGSLADTRATIAVQQYMDTYEPLVEEQAF